MQPLIDSRLFTRAGALLNRLDAYQKTERPDVPLHVEDPVFEHRKSTVAGIEENRLVMTVGASSMVFSVWARAQLLSTVGTREKWFSKVSSEIEADELSLRTQSLKNQIARVRMLPDSDVLMLRGIVSTSYAHLPDMDLFGALHDACTDMLVMRGSTKTETSLYCYVANPTPMSIPGSTVRIYGGALVRNSEVGYTSLWVSPFHAWVYDEPDGSLKRRSVRVAVTEKGSFRRTHRGHITDLVSSLKGALTTTPLFDSPRKQLERTLSELGQIKYATETEAVTKGVSLLKSCKAPVGMRKMFETAYKASPRTVHTGFSVYETILQVAVEALRVDDAYKAFAVAGAVLHQLV